MSITSKILAGLAKLPTARFSGIRVEKDLPASMPDGITLLADRYYSQHNERVPIVLMRTPYGRKRFDAIGRIFAERGYQAVIQSVRGTFGSGGVFNAFRDEEKDGRVTLEWITRQEWFGGSLAMFGPSYLGFTQWSIAADAPRFVKALSIQVAASSRRDSLYPGESFFLDFALAWIHTLEIQEKPLWRVVSARIGEKRKLEPAFSTLPLESADVMAAGRKIGFYQDWLNHNAPGDPWWDEIDYSRKIGRVSAEVNLIAGWYDYYLPFELADYTALKNTGRNPFLTIGPWKHQDLGHFSAGLKESLSWFDAHLLGDASKLRRMPVRIFITGSCKWVEIPDWPPPADNIKWHIDSKGILSKEPPASCDPDGYVYDPSDPTPAVGGTLFSGSAGPRDNRRLESRKDVLTYTSTPLSEDLLIIGPVKAELYVRSSLENTDFFVRLCDVDPGGKSINVCDGLIRLWPERFTRAADGTMKIDVDLWPTACCFKKDHSLRVQISSGAHPRFCRNTGSGEPLGKAVNLKVAHQEIFHDPAHPSGIFLPHAVP